MFAAVAPVALPLRTVPSRRVSPVAAVISTLSPPAVSWNPPPIHLHANVRSCPFTTPSPLLSMIGIAYSFLPVSPISST